MKTLTHRKTKIIILFTLISTLLFADTVHTVVKGETFYSISRKYGVTLDQLYSMNGLDASSVLKIGQELIVKKEDNSKVTNNQEHINTKTYTVKSGDTFYSISRANGISVIDLQKLNNLSDKSVLKVGQIIQIPDNNVFKNSNTSTTNNKDSITEEISLPNQTDPRTYDINKKGNTSLVWPVKASEVTYISGKISGVSLTATKNESVTAIKAGTVMFSGLYRGFGYVVFVQSNTGHIYVYAGLDSVTSKKGDYVSYGTKLGVIGIDGLTGKSSMNLMVYKNGKVLDPATVPRG